MSQIAQQLIGAWELVSWHIHLPNECVVYPYGEDAVGYLFYTPDGRMSVHVAKNHRAPCSSENILQVSSDDAYRAFNEAASYCGHYDIVDNKVRHTIEICSFPNWVGRTQERTFKFTDNELCLSHQFLFEDLTADSFLVWRKNRVKTS